MYVLTVLRGVSDEMVMEELRRTVEGLAKPFSSYLGLEVKAKVKEREAQSRLRPLI